MNNILKQPERMFDYARLYTASVASTLIWGQRAADLDSFWYKEFYELMDLVCYRHPLRFFLKYSANDPQWVKIEELGANPPIDEFPFLKYLPGNWKTRADKCKELQTAMWTKARAIIDKRRAEGDKRDCFIDTKLDDLKPRGFPCPNTLSTTSLGYCLRLEQIQRPTRS